MSRYIDADNFERACMSDKNCEDMQDVIYKLRDYPTADVVEVRHGHWIRYDDLVVSCECSVCGEKFNLYEDDVLGYPYCPNCGAKMDGKEQENDT